MSRSYLYMTAAALFWAGAFIAGKIGGAEVSGVEMSFYRFATAVVCLFVYGKIRGLSFRIERKKALTIMLIGVFGMVGYHLLFFESLHTIDVLEASSINTLNPVLSAVLGFILFKEPLSRRGIFFLLTTTFGVLTIIIKWNFSALSSIGSTRGTLLMISAMLIWVVYSMLVKRFVKNIPSVVSSFYTLSGGAVFLLPFILVKGTSPLSYTSNIWLVFIFMGVFSTFLGYTLQQDSIMKIGVSRTNFFINFIPVFSMVLGIIILGDPFRISSIFSLAIISVGLVGFLNEKERLLLHADT